MIERISTCFVAFSSLPFSALTNFYKCFFYGVNISLACPQFVAGNHLAVVFAQGEQFGLSERYEKMGERPQPGSPTVPPAGWHWAGPLGILTPTMLFATVVGYVPPNGIEDV